MVEGEEGREKEGKKQGDGVGHSTWGGDGRRKGDKIKGRSGVRENLPLVVKVDVVAGVYAGATYT